MSQAGIYVQSGVTPITPVETLTGNTGGAVGPDGTNNINIVNVNTTVDIQGNAGLNTLTQQFGISNLVFGDDLSNLTTGTANVGMGLNVFNQITSGSNNTTIGFQSSDAITTGVQNTVIGATALGNLTTGSYNTIFGYGTGSAYNAAQSSNILIANTGDVADNNTIRIGNQGNGAGQQNRNFQAGIYNVTPAIASPKPVVIDSAGQLGTDSGSGILLTLTGNTGGAIAPVAGNINIVNANTTVDIAGTAGTLTQDFGISNLILGSDASSIAGATENVGLGQSSFANLTSGSANIAIGFNSGVGITSGSRNISIGRSSNGSSPATGTDNIAIGYGAIALVGGTTNTYNISIGSLAGSVNPGSNASSNILLNAINMNNASNQLIIGNGTGTGAQQLSSARICGIDGVNVGSVAKVVTMASDQLGTATITAGTGITVTPGANTITISATTTGMPWTVVTGASQALAVNNGYIANNAGTINFSLPASSIVGDTIRITGINNATGWQITQAVGQQIFFGSASTTSGAGGSITSSQTRDSIEIVCVVANTVWNVLSSVGNPTIV